MPPQIYQRVMDNILYSMKRLPASEGRSQQGDKKFDVFQSGDVAPTHEKPVLGKRSYIDDIVFEDETWEGIKEKTESFLKACREWGMTLSAPKGEFGKRTVSHLGHAVSKEGLKAKPKNLEDLKELEFPSSLKAMQSFLGSLNYYNRFIDDGIRQRTDLFDLDGDRIAMLEKHWRFASPADSVGSSSEDHGPRSQSGRSA